LLFDEERPRNDALLRSRQGSELRVSNAAAQTRIVSGGPFITTPHVDELKRRFGAFFNLVYVRSDDAGRIVAHFTLYNMIGWQVGPGREQWNARKEVGLISNALDPAVWSGKIAEHVDIPVSPKRLAKAVQVRRACNCIKTTRGALLQRAHDAPLPTPPRGRNALGNARRRGKQMVLMRLGDAMRISPFPSADHLDAREAGSFFSDWHRAGG